MTKSRIHDLQTVEKTPTSPAALRHKVGEMILGSTAVRAKVEALNPDTGEYRIVLQGTLATDEAKFGDI